LHANHSLPPEMHRSTPPLQPQPAQKTLWAEARKATGRGKDRFTVRDLLADQRCTRAVLDFLRTTKMGSRVGLRAVPPKPGEDGEVVQEGAEEMEAGGRGELSLLCQSLREPSLLCRSFESFSLSFCLSVCLSFFPSFFLSFSLLLGQAGRGQRELPRAAGGLLEVAADGEQERTVYNILMIQQGRTRSMKHHHHQPTPAGWGYLTCSARSGVHSDSSEDRHRRCRFARTGLRMDIYHDGKSNRRAGE